MSQETAPEPGQDTTVLTEFQIAVARLFFSLPEAEGFLLAGGAALVAQRLIVRPTRDLDLFTCPGRGDVAAARDALESAADQQGWQIRRIRDGADFTRLVVSGPGEEVLVDLAVDAVPERPVSQTPVGPALDAAELAGRR